MAQIYITYCSYFLIIACICFLRGRRRFAVCFPTTNTGVLFQVFGGLAKSAAAGCDKQDDGLAGKGAEIGD